MKFELWNGSVRKKILWKIFCFLCNLSIILLVSNYFNRTTKIHSFDLENHILFITFEAPCIFSQREYVLGDKYIFPIGFTELLSNNKSSPFFVFIPSPLCTPLIVTISETIPTENFKNFDYLPLSGVKTSEGHIDQSFIPSSYQHRRPKAKLASKLKCMNLCVNFAIHATPSFIGKTPASFRSFLLRIQFLFVKIFNCYSGMFIQAFLGTCGHLMIVC